MFAISIAARRVRVAFAGVALMAVSACADSPAYDYRQVYPLPVQAETVALPTHVGGSEWPMAGDERARFGALVAGYLDRGHGAIAIAAREYVDLDRARDRLIAAGVPASQLRLVLARESEPETVTLSYQRYNVALPLCGDWSAPPTMNFYNEVQPNFGCAMQYNIGLMIADPSDLVRMRATDPTDAQNAGRVMQKFRTGQSPAATQSPLQTTGAAGIVTLGH